MKKNWNNPAIKSLNVEYTHEEEYDGWVLGDDGSKLMLNLLIEVKIQHVLESLDISVGAVEQNQDIFMLLQLEL